MKMIFRFIVGIAFFFTFTIAEPVAQDVDTWKDMVAIVQNKGYAIEQHFAVTEDGYILGLFRIPCPRFQSPSDLSCMTNMRNRPPVLLQHGLLDSSFTFVNNFPDQSLAFLLADAGFDVWLGNNRGTTWSKRHLTLDTKDDAYWMFTWDEMAKYDLPSTIQYVLSATSSTRLAAYIGHSEGTIQAFAGFSLKQNKAIADAINVFIALAPVAYAHNIESKPFKLLAELDLAIFLEMYGWQEFLPSDTVLVQNIDPKFCMQYPETCDEVVATVCGPTSNINTTRYQVYVSSTPAGTSTLNMWHWTQGVKHDKFQAFDYGPQGNLEHYHSVSPPEYKLADVKVPMALFRGGNDYLADPIDVERLMSELDPNYIIYDNLQEDYAHLDFTWAFNANERIYNDVIDIIRLQMK